MRKSPKDPTVCRRAVLLAPTALAAAPALPSGALTHQFDRWLAERQLLEATLDRTPEATQGAARERLFDEIFDLEALILNTECLELPAIRAKARLVTWYMEMDDADGLVAMRHIQSYLDRQD